MADLETNRVEPVETIKSLKQEVHGGLWEARALFDRGDTMGFRSKLIDLIAIADRAPTPSSEPKPSVASHYTVIDGTRMTFFQGILYAELTRRNDEGEYAVTTEAEVLDRIYESGLLARYENTKRNREKLMGGVENARRKLAKKLPEDKANDLIRQLEKDAEPEPEPVLSHTNAVENPLPERLAQYEHLLPEGPPEKDAGDATVVYSPRTDNEIQAFAADSRLFRPPDQEIPETSTLKPTRVDKRAPRVEIKITDRYSIQLGELDAEIIRVVRESPSSVPEIAKKLDKDFTPTFQARVSRAMSLANLQLHRSRSPVFLSWIKGGAAGKQYARGVLGFVNFRDPTAFASLPALDESTGAVGSLEEFDNNERVEADIPAPALAIPTPPVAEVPVYVPARSDDQSNTHVRRPKMTKPVRQEPTLRRPEVQAPMPGSFFEPGEVIVLATTILNLPDAKLHGMRIRLTPEEKDGIRILLQTLTAKINPQVMKEIRSYQGPVWRKLDSLKHGNKRPLMLPNFFLALDGQLAFILRRLNDTNLDQLKSEAMKSFPPKKPSVRVEW